MAADARLARAIHEGGVERLDARGLMPIEEARALLATATTFARGELLQRGAQSYTEADRLWAALLSLADAAEFVDHASRLDWQFHPRGLDNVDLVLRYGDGVVPWLATRLDEDGQVSAAPWCVLPCLLACGSPEAFALAWRVPDDPLAARPVLRTWCDRHPEVAAAELSRRWASPRARAHLAGMELRGLPVAPSPRPRVDQALALLDACALGLAAGHLVTWPAVEGTGASTPHAFRAVAARGDDAWGIAVQRIEGTRASGIHAARALTFLYGPRVPARVAQRALPLALDGAPAAGPELAAWLRAQPLDRLLGPPDALLASLGLTDAARVVAVDDALEHVAAPDLPSGSRAYQALASALDEE